MATDLDLYAIKERIEAVLENNSTLYDDTGANSKVRQIDAGAPDLNAISRETVLPHIFITNDDIIEDITQEAPTISNAAKTLEHTVNFLIILVVDGKDGPKAEETADDFAKLIKEEITGNTDLRDPSNGSDPKVARCLITQHAILNRNLFGSSKQGRVFRLRCVAYTS